VNAETADVNVTNRLPIILGIGTVDVADLVELRDVDNRNRLLEITDCVRQRRPVQSQSRWVHQDAVGIHVFVHEVDQLVLMVRLEVVDIDTQLLAECDDPSTTSCNVAVP
jgi:hypothetical protein